MRPQRVFAGVLSGLLATSGLFAQGYDDPPVGGEEAPAGCVGVAATVRVNQGTVVFTPATIEVNAGEPVCWTWSSDMDHNVQSDVAGLFRSGAPAKNVTYQRTFSSPGTFGYYCQVHGSSTAGMRGTVVVREADGGGGSSGPGSLRFPTETFEASEADGIARITVQRAGGSEGAASVQYDTVAGTAKVKQDFTRKKGTLRWGNGDGEPKTIEVPLKNDGVAEPTETFSVRLTRPTGAALETSSATVSVRDDDGGCSTASLAAPASLRAAGQSRREIQLSWALEPAGATALHIERAPIDGPFAEIAAVAPGLGSFTDVGLAAATTYLYRVRAEGPDGLSTYTDVIAAATDGSTADCAATALCLHDGRFEAIVEWRSVAGMPRRTARREPLGEPAAAGLFALEGGAPQLLLGIADRCAQSHHFAISLATASEAELLVRVRDTTTGRTWAYYGADGAGVALSELDALDSCP